MLHAKVTVVNEQMEITSDDKDKILSTVADMQLCWHAHEP